MNVVWVALRPPAILGNCVLLPNQRCPPCVLAQKPNPANVAGLQFREGTVVNSPNSAHSFPGLLVLMPGNHLRFASFSTEMV